MTPDTRRFLICLLASLVAHALMLTLAAQIRLPADFALPVTHPRMMLITLALPRTSPPRPMKRLKPPVRAARHTSPREGKSLPRTQAKPGARVHMPSVAALPQAAPLPASASRLEVAENRSQLTLVKASQTPLSLAPTSQKSAAPAPGTAPVSGGDGIAQKEAGSGDGKGSGSGAGRNAGEPFGVGAGLTGNGGPRHVVYVLDISGSMTSRIDRAEEELRRALSGLGPGETFNIIAFGDSVQQFGAAMAPASADTEKQASRFLRSLKVGGGTNLQAAMTLALTPADVNEVVLLTDGVPTVGETDFGKMARRIRMLNKNHARISTVGLIGKNPDGTDDSFEARGLLTQIAQESGGACELVTLGTTSP